MKQQTAKPGTPQTRGEHGNNFPPIIFIACLFFMFLPAFKIFSQTRALNYEILRNGNKVGKLHFAQSSIDGMNYMKIESDVKTRFVFTFTAMSKEEAFYYNGILVRSSIFRQMNGKEKANKQHQAVNKQYIISTGKNYAVARNYPITYNMLSLYSMEPGNISQVYSDNFETFIAIEKAGDHKYKITLPDGNYNYYYYGDGILKTVEIHHSLYSASIVLVQ